MFKPCNLGNQSVLIWMFESVQRLKRNCERKFDFNSLVIYKELPQGKKIRTYSDKMDIVNDTMISWVDEGRQSCFFNKYADPTLLIQAIRYKYSQ